MLFGGSMVFTFPLQSADTAESGKLFLRTQISERQVLCLCSVSPWRLAGSVPDF